jgi:hypothetical protein
MKANPERLVEFDLVITVDCGLEFGVYNPTDYRKDPTDVAPRAGPFAGRMRPSALPTLNDRK